MKNLGENWITEKTLDLEYKKYILLAYLQDIDREFCESKLYPSLAELHAHYRNALAFRESKKSMDDQFPQRLGHIDLAHFRMKYEKVLEDDAVMREIASIVEFSIPEFEKYVNEGKKIYDLVEEQLIISPVGVMPLHAGEGYMFLKDGKNADTKVYEYQIRLFEQPGERHRGIYTHYMCSFSNNYVNTFESIKTDMIRSNPVLPNPAAYAIETELVLPIEETFLPIAKRILVKYVSRNAVS